MAELPAVYRDPADSQGTAVSRWDRGEASASVLRGNLIERVMKRVMSHSKAARMATKGGHREEPSWAPGSTLQASRLTRNSPPIHLGCT